MKSYILFSTIVSLLLAGCSLEQKKYTTDINHPSPLTEKSINHLREKIAIDTLKQAPEKGCNYDINDYFSFLEQYEVPLNEAKKWFEKSNVQGLESTLSKRFNHILDKFINTYYLSKTSSPILRIEIGSDWVHSNNAYEIEVKQRRGIKITRIPPDKKIAFFYPPEIFNERVIQCQK